MSSSSYGLFLRANWKSKKVGISVGFSAYKVLFMAFDANTTAFFLLITIEDYIIQ